MQTAAGRVQWAAVAKWATVDISGFNLHELPDEVASLVRAQKIDISHNKLTSLGPLLKLTGLTRVNVRDEVISLTCVDQFGKQSFERIAKYTW